MNLQLSSSHQPRVGQLTALAVCGALALLTSATACVTENTTTGEMVPRGNQRYPWEEVQERAKRLEDGMSKGQVLNLMGSPAETDEADARWTYLPERHGLLVPAKALHLEFENGVLAKHEYRSIVFGAKL